MQPGGFVHGPYLHQLNKGGLRAIVTSNALKATEARAAAGGSAAVRARVGSFETLEKPHIRTEINPIPLKSPRTVLIEFYTVKAPQPHQAPGLATWYMMDGGFLSIQITGIFYGNGDQVDLGKLDAAHV